MDQDWCAPTHRAPARPRGISARAVDHSARLSYTEDMDDLDIERIARQVFAAGRDRARFAPLRGDDAPATLDEAYPIQARVYALYEAAADAGPLGGHKIALTSKAVQELCGIDTPAYGAVFRDEVRAAPIALRRSDFVHLGLEFEVIVTIAADVPYADAPYDHDSIADYIEACAPAFEIIEDRNADYGDLDAESVVADRCWCYGAVHGPWATNWRNLNFATLPVKLYWNGKVVDRAVTGASMGHPFAGLAWVANHLYTRGRTLAKGEIVMTGSALKTRFPEAGDHVRYVIEGLGETELRIEA